MNAPDTFIRGADATDRQRQLSAYRAVRQATVAFTASLSAEDCQSQSMPDASPVKWHLAHTTWFFETFLLGAFVPSYTPACPQYRVLFNSYYNAVGEKHPRPQRGLLTRPTLEQVLAYRAAVDQAMVEAIGGRLGRSGSAADFERLLTLGLHHEQQHQELILTDVKHLLSCNPMGPAFVDAGKDTATIGGSPSPDQAPADVPAMTFVPFDGGIRTIGHQGEGFCFDNETPAHRVLLEPFELADRLVTCGEYLAFIDAGGYEQPEHWLSMGWDAVQAGGWRLPFYWRRTAEAAAGPEQAGEAPREGNRIEAFTLSGWQPLDLASPVSHLSLFEADAFARWSGHRLPTEAEWEHAASSVPIPPEANLLERGLLRPDTAGGTPIGQVGRDGAAGRAVAETGHRLAEPGRAGLKQLWGDLWEWTASPYVPYPGFRTSPGAVGEYNGKFMCNQYVLRGGSFATSRSHIRASYRNFFPPEARWQFTGLRLARDGGRPGVPSPRR